MAKQASIELKNLTKEYVTHEGTGTFLAVDHINVNIGICNALGAVRLWKNDDTPHDCRIRVCFRRRYPSGWDPDQ